jgi:hypothetical protein
MITMTLEWGHYLRNRINEMIQIALDKKDIVQIKMNSYTVQVIPEGKVSKMYNVVGSINEDAKMTVGPFESRQNAETAAANMVQHKFESIDIIDEDDEEVPG